MNRRGFFKGLFGGVAAIGAGVLAKKVEALPALAPEPVAPPVVPAVPETTPDYGLSFQIDKKALMDDWSSGVVLGSGKTYTFQFPSHNYLSTATWAPISSEATYTIASTASSVSWGSSTASFVGYNSIGSSTGY